MAAETVTVPTLLLKATVGLLGLLVVAFGYWAETVDNVGREALTEIRKLGVELGKVQANQTVIIARQDDHTSKPWHKPAGEEIRDLRIQMEVLRRGADAANGARARENERGAGR